MDIHIHVNISEDAQPFERDPDEPTAHINRVVGELITADGEPYEDTISILWGTLVSAMNAKGGMSAYEKVTIDELYYLIDRHYKKCFGIE